MPTSIMSAIRESILYDRIVHLDYNELAAALREEALEAGDTAMVDVIDQSAGDNGTEVIAALIAGLDPDVDVEDDVFDGQDTHELWGTLDGEPWRVHIDINNLL